MVPVPHDPRPHKRPFYGIIAFIFSVSAVLGFAVITAPFGIIIGITSLLKKEEQPWLGKVALGLSVVAIVLTVWLYLSFGHLTLLDVLAN